MLKKTPAELILRFQIECEVRDMFITPSSTSRFIIVRIACGSRRKNRGGFSITLSAVATSSALFIALVFLFYICAQRRPGGGGLVRMLRERERERERERRRVRCISIARTACERAFQRKRNRKRGDPFPLHKFIPPRFADFSFFVQTAAAHKVALGAWRSH